MKKKRLPFDQLAQIVGTDNLLKQEEDRFCYGYDASKLQACPGCVVLPADTQEIAQILQAANQHGIPVFPRGAGSGMVGGAIPDPNGIVMVLRRLNRILEIDPDNMLARVEPGVVTAEFQKRVLQYGLFYPPDPASIQFSTLGGNAATCAGGPRAVKYGVTRDYVLGLQVVLPTGTVIRTGTQTAKGVVGYDLTRLLVGSEGTLGIITELTLRLIPAPQAVRTLTALFARLENAGEAVSAITKNRIIPSTLELMDQSAIRVVENYTQMGLPADAEALLLIEVDGPERYLDEDIRKIAELCQQAGASEVKIANSQAERDQLWQARRAVSPALGKIKPGKINEDITVPRTQIPALIRFIRSLARKYHLIIVCFGHAGDGNIHTNIMLDRSDRDELRRAEQAVEELFRAVLDLGGTLSGEHGIGITKSPFIEWEVGPEGLQTMWKIKQALDPLNILNPGKMFVPNRAFFQP